jgi:hypothetical protein
MTPRQLLAFFRKPRELRFDSDAPVLISPCPPSELPPAPGRLVAIWQSGLELRCHRAIPAESPVAVEVGQALVFGKVRSCRLQSSGSFEIEIQTQHVDMSCSIRPVARNASADRMDAAS